MLDMVEPAKPTNVDPGHGTSVGSLLEFTIWTCLFEIVVMGHGITRLFEDNSLINSFNP